MSNPKYGVAAFIACLLAGCGSGGSASPDGEHAWVTDPFPSTYERYPSVPTFINNATVLDGIGGELTVGDVLMADGKIVEVGENLTPPDGAFVINAAGKWVTPGIIDNHSHLGVYPSPGVSAHGDGNEGSGPNTAEVWAEHSVWPQDPGFSRALAGGITSMQVLPGSANLFGGRGVVLKNINGRTVQEMKFPGAPASLKMACGENPKRVYGYGNGTFPGGAPYSRMGNFAGYRSAWIAAENYKKKFENGETPERNLELDTLAGALSGDVLVHMHCYRADEMVQVLDMAKEFGYKVSAFHHATESYKVADILADAGVCSSMWADWWGFKMEAYDAVRENIPMVHQAGACAIVHSDSEVGIQRLNQEAAKAWSDGRKSGIDIPKAEAWKWLSLNPAKSLGIDALTGSLEPGKMADVVIWDGDPFSVYTRAEHVFIDGAHLYDVHNPAMQPIADFELGQPGEGDAK